MDYGGRLDRLETLEQRGAVEGFTRLIAEEKVPLSAFVQTGLLTRFPDAAQVLKRLAVDFHSHSCSHARRGFESRVEMETSRKAVQDIFNVPCGGYRAPFGRFHPSDMEILADLGYDFDASVFPSYRPGVFSNIGASLDPGLWPCGLLEIPFGVVPRARLVLGISYMKLLGYGVYSALMRLFDLPRVVVFYGHLHDYMPTPGLSELPFAVRSAFARNSGQACAITRRFFAHLRRRGYVFLTMSDLAARLRAEELPAYRLGLNIEGKKWPLESGGGL